MPGIGQVDTYATLELTDEHGAKERTGVLRVSDILESLGGVLAGLGDKNLVTTRVLSDPKVRETVDQEFGMVPSVIVMSSADVRRKWFDASSSGSERAKALTCAESEER